MMKKLLLLSSFLLIGFSCFTQSNSNNTKARKLTYSDFTAEFGINDTANAIIDIFFDKRENAALGEMSFLPISLVLAVIPQTRIVGVGTAIISLPLFAHGLYTLLKFRKKKLVLILLEYKSTKELPNWVRKKVNKQLALYKIIEREY